MIRDRVKEMRRGRASALRPSPRNWREHPPAGVTWGDKYPRLQILTVADLLEGRGVQMPPRALTSTTLKRAPRAKSAPGAQKEMFPGREG
jgi:hypothetical protein